MMTLAVSMQSTSIPTFNGIMFILLPQKTFRLVFLQKNKKKLDSISASCGYIKKIVSDDTVRGKERER